MKKLLKRITFLTLVFLIFFYIGCKSGCNQLTRELVAQLYATAISYPENFPDWIKKNKDLFKSGGQWQKCSERLSFQLIKRALDSYTPNETYERAMSIASEAGAPHLGSSVANSINQSATDMYTIGVWLNSFSKSVIEIQNGNSAAYYRSDVYNTISSMWNLMAMYASQNDIVAMKKIMHEFNVWMMRQFVQQIK